MKFFVLMPLPNRSIRLQGYTNVILIYKTYLKLRINYNYVSKLKSFY